MTNNFVTISEIETYNFCPRKHHLRYRDGIVPVQKPYAMRLGSVVHEALQAYHNNDAYAYNDARNSIISNTLSEPRLRIQALNMLAEYDKIVYCDKLRFGDSKVEQEWTKTYRDVEFRGKIDIVMTNLQTGEVYLVEHKTTTRSDATYLTEKWCSPQVMLYAWATGAKHIMHNIFKHSNYEIKAGESEMEFEARKLTMERPKQAKRKLPETDDEYAERHLKSVQIIREAIPVFEDEVEDVMLDLWRAAKEILAIPQVMQIGGESRRNLSSCYRNGRPCQYIALCQNRNNQFVLSSGEYEILEPHSELTTTPESED